VSAFTTRGLNLNRRQTIIKTTSQIAGPSLHHPLHLRCLLVRYLRWSRAGLAATLWIVSALESI